MRLALPIATVLLGLAACPAPEPVPTDADRDGVLSDVDCDDADPFVYPGAQERCNGVDDDCDGTVDGDGATGSTLWYVDVDGDGFGDPETAVRSCAMPEGHVARGEDCDDGDAEVHPGRADGCDGVDSDCDGEVDDDPNQRAWLDLDGDGHGGPIEGWGCVGVDATAEPTDCDDEDAAVFPGADERCNGGIDDDCDGRADDLDPEGPVDPVPWYADVDLDGFGDSDIFTLACEAPTGNVSDVPGDCDDGDARTWPGAFEGCEPVDRDCDGELPDATAWWSEAFPVRLPLEVTALEDRPEPVLSITVDLSEAAGTAFDPRTLALVVQDCAGAGAVRLDAEFTDGLGGVFDGAVSLPLEDGIGGLHAVLDRALSAGEPLALALYALGPIASTPGDAVATANELGSGAVTARFDLVEGGLPEVSVGALEGIVPDGRVAGAPADGVVGPAGAGGTLARGFATGDVVQAGEMVAALDVVTPYLPSGPMDAAVEQRVRWVAISGRPELYGWVTTEVVAEGGVTGLGMLGFDAAGQRDVAVPTDHGGFASWSAPAGHVAFGWVVPPAFDAGITNVGDALVLSGADTALPVAPASVGALLVDGALVMVRAAEGPVDASLPAIDAALAPGLDVVVGAPETL